MSIPGPQASRLQETVIDKSEAHSKRSLPPSAALALLGAVVLDTIAQLLWKSGADSGKAANLFETAINTLCQPLFVLAMLMFIPKYFNWMYVLARVDLTYAKPITSLSFITILLFSALLLHEQITPFKLIGIVLILIGVWQVSRTEANTSAQPGEGQS
jgi:drug/metabolite transporter (DMT)-like permease